MTDAQDGTLTCVGDIEGTGPSEFNRGHTVTNVYFECPIPVRYCGGPPRTRRKDRAMAQRAKRIAEENSHHDCDFRDMLSRVGDKWSLLVIFILKGRPAFRGRFSDLKRSIPGISQRMLTATVRNLERDGMLTRHVYAEVPPRVEYELTPLGRGLTEPVLALVSWLQSNWPAIRSARDRFDARKKATRAVAQSVASATIRG